MWFGGILAVGLLFAVISATQEVAARRELAAADSLWAAGQKTEAAAKYQAAIDRGVSSLEPTQRPTIFQRVIEVEAERGNTSAAIALLEKADTYGVRIASNHPAVSGLLAESEARKDAAKYKEARKSAKGDQLKDMSLDDIQKRLGPPDERHQAAKTPNAFLYVWDDGKGTFITVAFMRMLDTGRAAILSAGDGQSRPVVENVKKAMDKF